MSEETEKRKGAAGKWTKRLGAAAFLFFLVKGLVWLALFIAAAYFGLDLLN